MPRGLHQKIAEEQKPNHESFKKMFVVRQLPRCTTQWWLDGRGSRLHQEQRLSHQERLGSKGSQGEARALCVFDLLTLIEFDPAAKNDNPRY